MSKMSATKNTKVGFVLGLTGSIATGKSTAAEVFKRHGIPVIDGDVVAREVVEPGTAGLSAIVEVFGKQILNEDGTLNRKQLGAIVFADNELRQTLNRVLNPFIRGRIKQQIAEKKQHNPLVVVDVPLLFEGQYERYMDAVAVVYTTEAIQLERLMKRNQLTEAEALKRIKTQWSIETKKERADFLFDNTQTKEALVQQVELWLKQQSFITN
ncbi:dephospho-CoA kinase [Enterococcus thailandicus]|uniref:dephospho-CoA kinase n=1 Tax=Enterococcus thailandicus TaxID=417368 RepID=UPI0022EBEFAD|nr:dephospho-CoA kinase [Enterococcus thailandicus]MDA3972795.1 dephospho-CoA kinase [Enterococcus thailandicus]MDA3975291.1 dephospho-CoA kinase [Enterococcus thailandicus]MDA3980255.1 dephospho-CoA kinase [Enterococcus thailandicus]